MAATPKVINCMRGYIPREHQAALDKRALILVPGRGKENRLNGISRTPRLKHRPDGRKYCRNYDYEGDFVHNPMDVNPGKGSSSLKLIIEALWNQFKPNQLKGIIGRFNTQPIHKYLGLEELVNGDCLFREECPYKQQDGKCTCIWRPYQFLSWYRAIKGQENLLEGTINGAWMTMFELRDAVRSLMTPELWRDECEDVPKKYLSIIPKNGTAEEIFAAKEHVAAYKILDIVETHQRTSFDAANCYGVALHQMGLALDRRYEDDLETMDIRMALNRRDPLIEKKRVAIRRVQELGVKAVEVIEEVKVIEEEFNIEEIEEKVEEQSQQDVDETLNDDEMVSVYEDALLDEEFVEFDEDEDSY